MTPREMIRKAMLDIGAISQGETPSASEYQDGLLTLNLMLDSWSADGFMIPCITREVFNFTTSQQTYKMGPNSVSLPSDFDTSRPSKIVNAGVIENGNELPIKIYTPDEWAAITLKSTESTLPQGVYPENTYPLETLNFWPIPSAGNSVALYSEKPFARITFLESSNDYSIPPGYTNAIVTNLSVKMCSSFNKAVTASLDKEATQSLAQVKRANTKPEYMVSDVIGLASGKKPFNWLTGE